MLQKRCLVRLGVTGGDASRAVPVVVRRMNGVMRTMNMMRVGCVGTGVRTVMAATGKCGG